MTLLVERLWPALAVAAALGFLFAAFGGRGRATASAGRTAWIIALLLLAAAVALSWSEVVPGACGLWLDLVVLLCDAYAAAAIMGAGVRRLVKRPTDDESPSDDGVVAKDPTAA